MAQDRIIYYEYGQKRFEVRRVLDGGEVGKGEVGHTIRTGKKSKGKQIATIGTAPNSVIIINDIDVPAQQQQLIDMGADTPYALAFSPTQDLLAVLASNGSISHHVSE
jgi:hypothetical protein